MYEQRQYYVYILAKHQNGALYTGMTNDLARRIHDHRSKAVPGHTRKYDIARLVWYETHPTLDSAYLREKRIKAWKRAWKIQLIETANPTWRDLTETLI
ncbi:GIY-YIG nuclease family protein [Pelagibacterium flavum]|uniref:GIY-YIG nuclease family protein n=1 Tax=Pelagibacterium flavum TaxID=2984530 RepID=A0ABY6IRT2_9HYPH|nr:GIY-YIG nuclease family protein [Pelagibacterium sp. YIM 151497]UYQ73337.1 GIY-YIG nuclease family protein [Pelagibacterium sp. YIM 151497]